jgi:hypothetical protein
MFIFFLGGGGIIIRISLTKIEKFGADISDIYEPEKYRSEV